MLSLVASAAVLGWAAHHFLQQKEQQLGTSQFESVAERALVGAQQTLRRRRSGTAALATLHASLFPNASDWPFVAVPNYNVIAREISWTSSGLEDTPFGHALYLVPLLRPDQVDDFNTFQETYLETYYPPARDVYELPPFTFPNGTVLSLPPSPYNVVAPFSQVYTPQPEHEQFIMLDIFATALFRPSIIHHLQLADERQANTFTAAADDDDSGCGIYTHLVRQAADPTVGPISHYTHPVYPNDSPSTVR